MNLVAIQQAKAEALRFVKRVNELEQTKPSHNDVLFGSKHTGAVRRASMDLSRQLASMRSR